MIYTIVPTSHIFVKYSNASSAFLYYKNYRINLLNGIKESYSIKEWFTKLRHLEVFRRHKKRVIHLFFELSHAILEIDDLNEDVLLAIDIQYEESEAIQLETNCKSINLSKTKQVSYDDYKKDFDVVQENLEMGNCYQLNLTYPFISSFDKKLGPFDFISKLWSKRSQIGAYAHATYIPYLGKLFLSNSPECLFQLHQRENENILVSMPIKGTLKCSSLSEVPSVLKEFKKCSKNRAELNMITDLLRNDLSKIEEPHAKVVFKNKPLYVPGILHQYSLIKTSLRIKIDLFKILKALFPGGSITGAPKKSVTLLLDKVESYGRGFYCGSTILLDKNVKAASINIRSAEICFNSNKMKYGAGGGITLKSNVREEYEEMHLKYKSFIKLLK